MELWLVIEFGIVFVAEKRIAMGDALFLGYLIGMQDSVTMSNEQRRYFMVQFWDNPFGLKDCTV